MNEREGRRPPDKPGDGEEGGSGADNPVVTASGALAFRRLLEYMTEIDWWQDVLMEAVLADDPSVGLRSPLASVEASSHTIRAYAEAVASAVENELYAIDGGPGEVEQIERLKGPSTHVCWTPDGKPAEEREEVVLVRHRDLVALERLTNDWMTIASNTLEMLTESRKQRQRQDRKLKRLLDPTNDPEDLYG